MTDRSVQVFGKDTCPYTTAAREDFGKRGVKVEFFDVQRDPAAMKRFLDLSGGARRVPLIREGDKVTVGFDGGT
jgi:glutaredoxin-related protein